MSEHFYQQLMLHPIKQVFHICVTSAPENTLSPLGTVKCPFKLGGHSFGFAFIICRILSRSLILCLAFMQRYCIGLRWSDMVKGLLTQGKNVLIETVHVCKVGPHILMQTT